MNFKGIKLLKSMGLPGPNKNQIIDSCYSIDAIFSNINEDYFYESPGEKASIIVFDAREPINLWQELESNIRDFNVDKPNFKKVLTEKVKEMNKIVPIKDIGIVLHQSYSELISLCGKCSAKIDQDGFGNFSIDFKEGLRNADQGYDPEYKLFWRINAGRIKLNSREFICKGEKIPFLEAENSDLMKKLQPYIAQIHKEIGKIVHLCPLADFEIYKETGKLFYHDFSSMYNQFNNIFRRYMINN